MVNPSLHDSRKDQAKTKDKNLTHEHPVRTSPNRVRPVVVSKPHHRLKKKSSVAKLEGRLDFKPDYSYFRRRNKINPSSVLHVPKHR